jgi:hypothetical protein
MDSSKVEDFIVYVRLIGEGIEKHLFAIPNIEATSKMDAINLARESCEGQIRYNLARYNIQYSDVEWDAEVKND